MITRRSSTILSSTKQSLKERSPILGQKTEVPHIKGITEITASPDYCCISLQPLWHTSASPNSDNQHSLEKDDQMVGRKETATSRCGED
jgi:hypothetical protein